MSVIIPPSSTPISVPGRTPTTILTVDIMTEGEPVEAVSEAEFLAHVQASEPHPAYDDIPSLTLLFENGLV